VLLVLWIEEPEVLAEGSAEVAEGCAFFSGHATGDGGELIQHGVEAI
jgi:putative hemolysin